MWTAAVAGRGGCLRVQACPRRPRASLRKEERNDGYFENVKEERIQI
jgi:hypothetical protein